MKKMTRGQLIFSCIGMALGLATVTYSGYLIAYSGKAAILTLLLAIVLGTFMALPYVFLSRRAVVAGGAYGLTAAGLSPVVSAVGNYMGVVTMLIYAVSPMAIASYIISLAPALASYSQWVALAVAIVTYFIVSGKVSNMGKLQTVFSVALLVGLIAFIILGAIHIAQNGTGDGTGLFDFSNDPIFTQTGFGGIFSGLPLCLGSMSLYMMMLYYGPIAEKPKTNIPIAMFCGMAATVFFWVSLTIVDANVLPVAEAAGQPLTVVATAIMPSALVKVFVIVGPIMAILTTYIAGMPGNLETAAKMAEEGWLPKVLAKRNKYGRPWIICLLYTIVPMLLVVFKVPITTVQNMVILCSGPGGILAIIAMIRLTQKTPEYFRGKKDIALFYFLCIMSILVGLFNYGLSVRNAGVTVALVTLAIFGGLSLFCYIRRNRIKKVKVSDYLIDYEEVKAEVNAVKN